MDSRRSRRCRDSPAVDAQNLLRLRVLMMLGVSWRRSWRAEDRVRRPAAAASRAQRRGVLPLLRSRVTDGAIGGSAAAVAATAIIAAAKLSVGVVDAASYSIRRASVDTSGFEVEPAGGGVSGATYFVQSLCRFRRFCPMISGRRDGDVTASSSTAGWRERYVAFIATRSASGWRDRDVAAGSTAGWRNWREAAGDGAIV